MDDDGVFVYMGGNQRVPRNVTHVRIHKSVKIITRRAFMHCQYLESIEMHNGVEIIEDQAFYNCISLRGIKLLGVRDIEFGAFNNCIALVDVKFGDKLDRIGEGAFENCNSLSNIKIPKVRVLGIDAFFDCDELKHVELSEDLVRIGRRAISNCPLLRRIAIPLKYDLFNANEEDMFDDCPNLFQIDPIGGIRQTISSLLLKSWTSEMIDEIDRINRELPYTDPDYKTALIQQWIVTVLERMEHYKSEHYALLKNNMTQLELALWKVNLPNVDAATSSRHEARVTCGANIIIPHVLSFLNDEEEFPTVRDNPL